MSNHDIESNKDKQIKATAYYDKFSRIYDLLSPKHYYHKARTQAIKQLQLSEGKTVLNVPVGTGQNFEYFQHYLNNKGVIVGVDISSGMLDKAQKKIDQHQWHNVQLLNQDITNLETNVKYFDAILCDLGLSGFPQWQAVIDSLITMLSPNGRIVIMDWYIEKPSLTGQLVQWVGRGEVNRPLWQYLETKVTDFHVDSSFNRGNVFVASGTKITP